MPETRLEFHYTRPDVVSAQRMRFLRSPQLRWILIIWAASILFLSAPLILPQVFKPGPYSSWALVVQISLAYFVTLLVITFITPWVDFTVNRFWRLPLTLQYNEKQLKVAVKDKPGGLRLKWNQILRVDENDRAFILHYGSGGKFFILPKSAFNQPADEQHFRDLLSRRSQAAAGEPDEEEPETQEKE